MNDFPYDFGHVRNAFDAADTDHDGHLYTRELLAVLDRLGRPATAGCGAELMRTYDADASGTIDFDEFVALLSGVPGARMPHGGEHSAGTHRRDAV
ncbi:EF-hand domain-containing protein [Yinghuangia soli]|uniref:EF-hand domain-containing protein n=1 Tax=Yinghuangia soli TaxID=2908204 RepID=A0AA41Q9X0_9ACTN|nr:EF-hand domain-containing protein [Yinghuangia soli]MCF2533436.1 EF-hand domain-containing protein [Yinghuangia soli]